MRELYNGAYTNHSVLPKTRGEPFKNKIEAVGKLTKNSSAIKQIVQFTQNLTFLINWRFAKYDNRILDKKDDVGHRRQINKMVYIISQDVDKLRIGFLIPINKVQTQILPLQNTSSEFVGITSLSRTSQKRPTPL